MASQPNVVPSYLERSRARFRWTLRARRADRRRDGEQSKQKSILRHGLPPRRADRCHHGRKPFFEGSRRVVLWTYPLRFPEKRVHKQLMGQGLPHLARRCVVAGAKQPRKEATFLPGEDLEVLEIGTDALDRSLGFPDAGIIVSS